jgi:FPC/CPF motif-containing protein YcgG
MTDRSEHYADAAFNDELGNAGSTYAAFRDGKLVLVRDPKEPVAPLAEFVHDSFRALVLNPKFSCVGAKSAFRTDSYRFGVYPTMTSPDGTAALVRDLWSFVDEHATFGDNFYTFVASFHGPVISSEHTWEHLVWTQLQRLHDLDREAHAWDPTVSSDPNAADFSFSVGGQAFFVVGLHPASTRWARRFAWPTLVFNAHHQFTRLRGQGNFERMRDVIRSRDQGLQGSLNPNLDDWGARSEARQYSGRPVEADWRCPFHADVNNKAA